MSSPVPVKPADTPAVLYEVFTRMLTAVRATVLAGLLFTPFVAQGGAAQSVTDRYALEFLGFRAGARLDELSRQIQSFGGGPLRCRRAKADHRVMECRGTLDGGSHPPVDVWISAIDSSAGVLALSSRVDSSQLETWRTVLQERYGRVGIRIQGSQSMLQWVRRGRMLRLTWRLERKERIASVSLVDGHVLDAWAHARMRPVPAAPTPVPSANRRDGSESSRRNPRAGSPEPPGSTP